MAELSMGIPAPSVHFAERRLGDGVTITTFNLVDSLTGLFKAGNQLRNVIWVDVAQTKLAILVILSDRVHVSLRANEEAEVVTAADSLDLDALTERHLHRVADLLSAHGEWPSKGLACLASSQSQIATRGE